MGNQDLQESSEHGERLASPLSESQDTDTQDESQPRSQASNGPSRELKPHASATGAWKVPTASVTMTETSGQVYGLGSKDAQSRHLRLSQEALNTIIGPMPVVDFFGAFLKCDPAIMLSMPPAEDAFNEVPENANREEDIYEPLVCLFE